jgi:hypothetical protein
MSESIQELRRYIRDKNQELLEIDAELVEPNAQEARLKAEILATHQTREFAPNGRPPRRVFAEFTGEVCMVRSQEWRGRNCAHEELQPRYRSRARKVRNLDAVDWDTRCDLFEELADLLPADREEAAASPRLRRRVVIADIEAARRALQRLFDAAEKDRTSQMRLPL